ncbi:MAG: DUF5979 domain-containing protein [Acidimicrobiia bacterium]
MKRSRFVPRALGIVAVAGLSFGMLAGVASSAEVTPVDKVTICHRTNANNNPYVVITPDVAGVLDGHAAQHTGPVWDATLKAQHIKWGDIIPAFWYLDKQGNLQHFDGQNIPAGQSILDNGCSTTPPPEQQFGSITVTKVVTGLPLTGAPADGTVPTEFTIQVTCDDGTDQALVFPVTGGSAEISEIEAGSECTVVEQGVDGFPTSTVVTYAPADAPVGFFVDADADVAVTVTNAFTSVAGEVVTPPVTPPLVAAEAVAVSPAFTG